MSRDVTDALVDTQWLEDHLDAPDIRVVDCSWFLPSDPRNALKEFKNCHIPGAVYFDIDAIADRTSSLPHMVPDPVAFSSAVRKLGLGDGLRIIAYDRAGGACAAARVWWMFRLFGHAEVSVLDGGLGAWMAEGRPVDDLPRTPGRRHFTARMQSPLLRSRKQIRANVDSEKELVVDVRAANRFAGAADEPREGVRKGRIPGSVNLPFTDLQVGDHGHMADPDVLRAKFAEAGLTPDKAIVSSCGSGVTACYIALAAHRLGYPDIAVYDGSWTEWGGDHTLPIAVGAPG
ncbi:MAG: 3-mercaptopyruvate sulfurtransferase [Rhodospirillaceae bacterium]